MAATITQAQRQMAFSLSRAPTAAPPRFESSSMTYGRWQREIDAIADTEALGDLLDRCAMKRGEHRPLCPFLAALQVPLLGVDRLQLGIGVGQAQRPKRLRVGLALDPIEEGRMPRLDPL